MEEPAAKDGSQRIPVQSVGECKSWQPPHVGDKPLVYCAQNEAQETEKLASRLTAFDGRPAASQSKPAPRTRLTSGELQQLIADAESQGRERGYQEGLSAGRAEGMQQGMQAASEQLQALQETVARISNALPEAMRVHNDELQTAVVELVAKVATAVVHAELSVSTTAIQQLVQAALAAVKAPDKAVTVYISDRDYQLLSGRDAVASSDWQLRADEALSCGDCRVDTRHAAIDYSVAQRLEQAIAALYAGLAADAEQPLP